MIAKYHLIVILKINSKTELDQHKLGSKSVFDAWFIGHFRVARLHFELFRNREIRTKVSVHFFFASSGHFLPLIMHFS